MSPFRSLVSLGLGLLHCIAVSSLRLPPPATSSTGARVWRMCAVNRVPSLYMSGGSNGDGKQGKETKKGEREPFPFKRFVKTLFFFNGPRKPRLLRWAFRNSAEEAGRVTRNRGRRRRGARAKAGSSSSGQAARDGVVMVTGATGGLGKRVVDLLCQRGVPVRALVRNRSKAVAMLCGGHEPGSGKGTGVDVVVGDIRDPSTLRPAFFQDVSAVVSCTAAIVQPSEGDGPDRAKYYQGITFYEPEVADIPEETEFMGLTNLVTALQRYSDLQGKVLFSSMPSYQERWGQWGALDDVVMGGVSESSLRMVPGAGEEGVGSDMGAVFAGEVKTSNSGGFVSARTRNLQPPLDLSGYDALCLRIKGDGNRYKFIIYDSPGWDRMSWCKSFDTVEGEWMDVDIAFDSFSPIFRTKTMKDTTPLNIGEIHSFQLMLSKFEYDGDLNPAFKPGQFSLSISSIKAVKKDETSGASPPRIVHVSSAGVTRPGKPGLDLDGEPPAVRMNDMLKGLLTYKLKAEDVVRGSGVQATIIRPCALTEEPKGAPMIVSQGDTIKGKISRNDVAEMCVEALSLPEAAGLTFEVKSDLAFSDHWEVDEAREGKGADGSLTAQRDYRNIFSGLKSGITGKEWMDGAAKPPPPTEAPKPLKRDGDGE